MHAASTHIEVCGGLAMCVPMDSIFEAK